MSGSPAEEVAYLDLADFFAVAEAVLQIPAEHLWAATRVELADSALAAPRAGFGETEAYPDLFSKAAVLLNRLARNHPLLDGNKRVAYLCMRIFLERNGWRFVAPTPDEVDTVVRAVAAGGLDEASLARWLQRHAVPHPS